MFAIVLLFAMPGAGAAQECANDPGIERGTSTSASGSTCENTADGAACNVVCDLGYFASPCADTGCTNAGLAKCTGGNWDAGPTCIGNAWACTCSNGGTDGPTGGSLVKQHDANTRCETEQNGEDCSECVSGYHLSSPAGLGAQTCQGAVATQPDFGAAILAAPVPCLFEKLICRWPRVHVRREQPIPAAIATPATLLMLGRRRRVWVRPYFVIVGVGTSWPILYTSVLRCKHVIARTFSPPRLLAENECSPWYWCCGGSGGDDCAPGDNWGCGVDSGSVDSCSPGTQLNAVTDNSCTLTCTNGKYIKSGSGVLQCGIMGGTATTDMVCEDKQCTCTVRMPSGVLDNAACTEKDGTFELPAGTCLLTAGTATSRTHCATHGEEDCSICNTVGFHWRGGVGGGGDDSPTAGDQQCDGASPLRLVLRTSASDCALRVPSD
jgi:hypothetical protein